MIAGDERPELARGGSHSIAQVLQRAYVTTAVRFARCIMSRRFSSTMTDARWACACATAASGTARLAVVSNADPYSTLVEMVGEDYLPRTFFERVKDIQLDEFSYFQVHLALKAPVRYALHEAERSGGRASDEREYGAGKAGRSSKRCGRRFAPASFPTHGCLHAICPTAFDPLQAPKPKHAASVYLPVPFQLKGKQPEDWVKLKNGFHGYGAQEFGGVTRPI